jgi:hypothetical protein
MEISPPFRLYQQLRLFHSKRFESQQANTIL